MTGATPAPGSLEDRLTAALTGPLAELGYDLEAVEITSAGRRRLLRIAVDRDEGVGLDDVAAVTRALDVVLEDGDVMGEQPYTLEVTSRGVERPLTAPRHWRRNRTRLVKVTRVDGSSLTGRVTAHDEAEDGGVRLEVSGREQQIAYADIRRAVVQIEFNRRAEPAPDDPAGLEESGDDEDDEQYEDDDHEEEED